MLTSGSGIYSINNKMFVKVDSMTEEVALKTRAYIYDVDGKDEWSGWIGNPKYDNPCNINRSGSAWKVVIWIIVALIVVLAAGFGWVAYRKHSVSKERYKRSEGKPRFDEDNGDESWDGSINGKLEKTGLKLE